MQETILLGFGTRGTVSCKRVGKSPPSTLEWFSVEVIYFSNIHEKSWVFHILLNTLHGLLFYLDFLKIFLLWVNFDI